VARPPAPAGGPTVCHVVTSLVSDRRALLRSTFTAEALTATVYVALSGTIGVVSFIVALVGVCVGVPLLIVALVGAPILCSVAAFNHLLAKAERRRAAALMDVEFPVRRFRGDGSLPRQFLTWAGSRGCWLELTYALIALPFAGWLGGFLTFCAWGGGIAFTTFPLWGWAPAGAGSLFGAQIGFAASAAVHVVAGVALLFSAPWVARGIASAQVAMARLLLEPSDREQLTARVGTLEETRAGMVAAADAERRRIERDLHDGAQQRLVALAMTLGRAKATEDPETARELLDEAHRESKEALVELRNLARGIHPAVLSDRGLDAAVSALAARCPVPVAVTVNLPRRAAPSVEAIAYFVVAEALTNVAKHAHASSASLDVHIEGDELVIEVADNGRGGARTRGNGLSGLRDRVRAVDGMLMVVSPEGEGTTLRVELPCEP
jgi:signal transduction histidine kinase